MGFIRRPYFTVTCDACERELGLYEWDEEYWEDCLNHLRDDHPGPPPRDIDVQRAEIQAFLRENSDG